MDKNKMAYKPLARKSDLVIQETGDELLIYDLKIHKAYCLNETSAPVWRLCNGKNSVSEISNTMSKQMKTEISEDFIWIALDQLNKDGLLKDGLESHFEGFSRREVIRKAGFASVIALPLISSVIAPSAINAQSGCLPAGTSVPDRPGADVGFPACNAYCNDPSVFTTCCSLSGTSLGRVRSGATFCNCINSMCT